jgi:hypothetical protein
VTHDRDVSLSFTGDFELKNILRLIVATVAILLAGQALAQRQPVPIVNHENVAITTQSAKPLTLEEVGKAIVTGARNHKWTVSPVAGQPKLQAKLDVRDKHTVVVEIDYSETAYSIRYLSSINMKYRVQDDVPVIHPFYNRWVSDLMKGIDSELAKL